jgi:hypothetical protein
MVCVSMVPKNLQYLLHNLGDLDINLIAIFTYGKYLKNKKIIIFQLTNPSSILGALIDCKEMKIKFKV